MVAEKAGCKNRCVNWAALPLLFVGRAHHPLGFKKPLRKIGPPRPPPCSEATYQGARANKPPSGRAVLHYKFIKKRWW